MQERLQLGGSHLQALVLDELLGPIDDVEVALGIHEPHVAGVVPALADRHGRRVLRLVEIAPHDLRAADPQLAFLARVTSRRPVTTSAIFTSVLGTMRPTEPGFIGALRVGLRCVTGLASVMP